jgi:hypothetical protein
MRFLAAALCLSALVLAQDEPRFKTSASFAKVSNRRTQPGGGLVFVGPQDALYINWFLGNHSGAVLQLLSPGESLAVRLETADGRSVPMMTTVEPEMHLWTRSQISPYEPLGAVEVEDGQSVGLHTVTRRASGQPIPPGEYRVTFDIDGRAAFQPIPVIIAPLDTAASEIEYLHIEAAFHMGHDPDKVLELRKAVVTLPGAQVTDRMALGKAYAELGRHQEAVRIFDPILPELVESVRRGSLIREGRHLRQIAPSYLAVGRQDTALRLLEADGVAMPSSQIPGMLKMLSSREPQRHPWYR